MKKSGKISNVINLRKIDENLSFLVYNEEKKKIGVVVFEI